MAFGCVSQKKTVIKLLFTILGDSTSVIRSRIIHFLLCASFVGKHPFIQHDVSSEDSDEEWVPPREKRKRMQQKIRKAKSRSPPKPVDNIVELDSETDSATVRTCDEEAFIAKLKAKVMFMFGLV